jgi:hypothetical protein
VALLVVQAVHLGADGSPHCGVGEGDAEDLRATQSNRPHTCRAHAHLLTPVGVPRPAALPTPPQRPQTRRYTCTRWMRGACAQHCNVRLHGWEGPGPSHPTPPHHTWSAPMSRRHTRCSSSMAVALRTSPCRARRNRLISSSCQPARRSTLQSAAAHGSDGGSGGGCGWESGVTNQAVRGNRRVGAPVLPSPGSAAAGKAWATIAGQPRREVRE